MAKNFLIIIDAQNDFIDMALSNQEAQKCIPNIVNRIKDFNEGVIITTQDTHDENYLETPEGKMLPVEHCIKNTEGWKINKDILFEINKKFEEGLNVSTINVKKPTFGSVELANIINNFARSTNEEVNIQVCGFCTDICVVSNVLMIKAMLYDLNNVNITVIEDCCAGVTNESHFAACVTMKSCQINII